MEGNLEFWIHISPDYGLFKVKGGEQLGQKLVHHLVSQGGGASQVGQQQVGDWLSEAQACDQHLEVEAPNSQIAGISLVNLCHCQALVEQLGERGRPIRQRVVRGDKAVGVQEGGGGDDSGQMGWGQEQHELLYQMFAVGKWENGGSGAKGEFRMMEDVEGGEGSTVAPGLSVVRGEGAGMAN